MTIVAWPVEDDYISIEPPDGHEAGREDYERARADAAMARLRKMVTEITESGCERKADSPCKMCRLLADIGPLPGELAR